MRIAIRVTVGLGVLSGLGGLGWGLGFCRGFRGLGV